MHAVQSALAAAFPDLHYRIVRTLSSGDSLVVECVLSGTHQGEFVGVPPTNRRIEVPAAFCLDVMGGKLTDCRSYFDGISLLEQIGGLPSPAAAAVTAGLP
jgi:predicted ester cyclase